MSLRLPGTHRQHQGRTGTARQAQPQANARGAPAPAATATQPPQPQPSAPTTPSTPKPAPQLIPAPPRSRKPAAITPESSPELSQDPAPMPSTPTPTPTTCDTSVPNSALENKPIFPPPHTAARSRHCASPRAHRRRFHRASLRATRSCWAHRSSRHPSPHAPLSSRHRPLRMPRPRIDSASPIRYRLPRP